MLANNSTSSSSSTTTTTVSSANNNPTSIDSSNEAQALIEQLVQQHQIQFNNKQTLSRHQVFDNLHHHHHHLHHLNPNINTTNDIGSHSPHSQPKFPTTARFSNMNANACQYVEINGQPNNQPQPPSLPPPIVHSTQATTAYLVQTPNGSALLIPPQTALNPTNHFLQTNPTVQQQNNTFSLNRNPYGITTIPLQNATAILNSNQPNNLIPHSSSVSNGTCFNARPESTTSANVYQTIDTEKYFSF